MKISKFKICFLLVIGLIFTIQVNAQLCGQYGATLNVKATDDKPIENASVQLLPLETDETKGKTFVRDKENLAKFKIEFFEGHIIKTKYKLLVSADGFETFEKVIEFPHCERQQFEVELKPALVMQEMDNSPLQKRLLDGKVGQIKLSGILYDETGAVIVGENIKIIKGKEKIAETKSAKDGSYEVKLHSGTYSIEYGGNYFIPYIIKDFYFADTFEGQFQRDIILKGKNPEPCGYAGICPPIIKEIIKIEERQKEFTKTIRTNNYDK